MISKANLELLKIIDDSIHGRNINEVSQDNWPQIFKELNDQTVHAIPADHLHALEGKAFDEFQIAYGKNLMVFYRILQAQSDVVEKLNAANIDAVILKGASAAMNYPSPESRCMGDIDIIVCPQDFSAAYNALLEAGYRTSETLDYPRRHVAFYSEDRVEIELHQSFASMDVPEYKEKLDHSIYEGIHSKELVTVCGYSVPVLPKLENGLVLLAHIEQHIGRGIGLRHILDWMCYVERYLDNQYWNDTFASAADSIGLKKLAIIVTGMCQKYLGLDSNITWCSYDPVCDDLMEYIFAHGNFGGKDHVSSKAVDAIRLFSNPIKAIKTLDEFGCDNWELLKKHHWLRPFAWIYQLVRWIEHGHRAGVSNPMKARELIQKENKESAMLNKLQIHR